MTDDIQLLRRYVSGKSDDAFRELVNRHIGLVYNAALRQLSGATHRAEDVTQAVFADLARKAPALLRRTDLVGWLFTSTHYAAAKLKRSESRRQRREQQAHLMAELNHPDCNEPDWTQLGPVLDAAMQELNELERLAVLLRCFKGQEYAEIGLALGTSADAARVRVARALERLRAALARRKITSTAAGLALTLANQPAMAVPAGLPATVAGAAIAGYAGSATIAITFMSYKTAAVVLVAAATAGIAGYSVLSTDRDAAGRSEVRQEPLPQRASQNNASQTAVQSPSMPRVRLQAPGPATPDPAAVTGRLSLSSALGLDPRDPEMKRQIRAQAVSNLDRSYGDLYVQLGWSDEQRDKFRDAMLAREDSISPLWKKAVTAARAENPSIDRAEIFEIHEATREMVGREEVADVRCLFDERAAQAFEQFRAELPSRYIVARLSESLSKTATPLHAPQASAVIKALSKNAVGPLGLVDIVSLNVESAANECAALLSPGQNAELTRIATAIQAQAQAERTRNTMPEARLRALLDAAASTRTSD